MERRQEMGERRRVTVNLQNFFLSAPLKDLILFCRMEAAAVAEDLRKHWIIECQVEEVIKVCLLFSPQATSLLLLLLGKTN